jgi:hypothetical protein
MFKRLFSRKPSELGIGGKLRDPDTPSIEFDEVPASIGFNEVSTQIEIPHKTIGTCTFDIERKDQSTSTENRNGLDNGVSTDSVALFDASVQVSVSRMDAGVDPGDWNYVVLRGIDTQTDAPDPADPQLWLSGSVPDSIELISKLIDSLEANELRSKCPSGTDALKLRAENVVLRMELNSLKKRGPKPLCTSISPKSSSVESRKLQRDFVTALVGGAGSSPFIVTTGSGVTVTSTLAPSSAPLGTLKNGDKVFLSGSPEEICGMLRGPVLPRGWVTLKDNHNTYLRKAG